jgi:glycosyltransferase involved in cell wall biosynthesis
LRIGIWCMEYTDTGPASILPGKGRGEYVHGLVGGLMDLEEPVEAVLIVHPRDQERIATRFVHDGGRVRVLSRPNVQPPARQRVGKLLTAWVRQSERIARQFRVVRTCLKSWHFVTRQSGQRMLRPLLIRASQGRPLELATLAVLIPFLFAVIWCLCGAALVSRALFAAVTLPVAWLDRALRRAQGSPRFQAPVPADADLTVEELRTVTAEANCTVWLLPSLCCNHDIRVPSIQLIPDLITHHFPDAFDPALVKRMQVLAPLRAQQALLVACTSGFVRDHDLLGLLELTPAKVRVIPPATIVNMPGTGGPVDRPSGLPRPYLLCPNAFGPHQNVQGVIKALRRLRDRHGVADLGLVLTGPAGAKLASEHQRLIEAYGLEGHIHVLGGVERGQVAALYHRAFATLVPSLYEAWSPEVVEALQCGCPVACARIPALLEQCKALGTAMLYFDPTDTDSLTRVVLTLCNYRDAVLRRQQEANKVLGKRTWKQVAAEWLPLFQEAAEIGGWPEEYRDRVVRCPWPVEPVPPPRPDEPLEMFLFLQHPYLGGVWESTKEVIKALFEVNERRRRLRITLGVQEEQVDVEALRQMAGDVPIERMRFEMLTHAEAARMLPAPPSASGMRPGQAYCFWSACARTALRADAWLALCDRFHNALLPARPYGVMVFDMIQRYVPEAFSSTFFVWRERGMIPTIQRANIVITTSAVTRADIISEYGLEAERLRLVPVACEPQRRLARLMPEHVPLPDRPFILHAANTSEHKGAGVMLRACGRLKERLGEAAPLLVMCGGFTEFFAPSREGTLARDEPHWHNMRNLVRDLELEEGRDVVFLGYVNDRQLLDLYQRCALVVNAARYDNGSFCMIEGQYFGKPILSSRYPAAELLCQRFGIAAKFFPINDAAALADLVAESVKEPPLPPAELEQVRARLSDPEFTLQRHAERLYDILVDLAQQGRQERLGRGSSRPLKVAA